MTTQYRLLSEGETIQEGDEGICGGGGWAPIQACIGDYCNKNIIRRPIKGQIIDLPEIPGYEYTGEYRVPKLDEYYLGLHGLPTKSLSSLAGSHRHLLRKIEKPKTYRPFKDYEEMKPHRERWVFFVRKNCFVEICPLWDAYNQHSLSDTPAEICLFEKWKFEDTGMPVGVCE